MRRVLLGTSIVLVTLSGCANSASESGTEPIMRLTIQMRGALDTSSTGVRYYVVFNTATTADDPVASASAEAPASVGIRPPSGGDPAGPRAYGPFLQDNPKIGWNLPFYLSGGLWPGDLRQTRSYTGTVPLLPVTWTDYFVLTSENGPLQLIHAQRPKPLTDPDTILPNVATLQQGQDWSVDKDKLVLLLRVSSLVNGTDINNANGLTSVPGITPTPAPVSPEQGRIVTANFITSNTLGQIIDRWTLSENEYGVVLRTALSSQDQSSKTRPILQPAFKPSGVSDDSVNFALYRSEIRR